jgi:hypothetical protein
MSIYWFMVIISREAQDSRRRDRDTLRADKMMIARLQWFYNNGYNCGRREAGRYEKEGRLLVPMK